MSLEDVTTIANCVLDEIPGAYKNVEAVMAAQSDLVEIAHTLKQVLCIKG
jgi:tRNA-splicing ligase RtcB (3'-phosphate/5'-hydroxy nucleic acid ligase)